MVQGRLLESRRLTRRLGAGGRHPAAEGGEVRFGDCVGGEGVADAGG